jgi:uroporphyrinogen-III synthase
MTPRLAGTTLLLTRAAEDAGPWTEALQAEGAATIVLPCIDAEVIADPTLGARLRAAIDAAGWLIFTSRRGVDAVAELLDNQLPGELQIATVGAATAARVAEHFGRVAHVGNGAGADLARELVEQELVGPDANCVLAVATNAGRILEQTLRGAGATVERFEIYRTIPAPVPAVKQPLSGIGCDAVIFASPSAVAGFDNQVAVDSPVPMFTIGPLTSTAVREHGWRVAAEAKAPNLTSILESMLENSGV